MKLKTKLQLATALAVVFSALLGVMAQTNTISTKVETVIVTNWHTITRTETPAIYINQSNNLCRSIVYTEIGIVETNLVAVLVTNKTQ